MIVVSNTGPLNYLILLGAVQHLPSLYGNLIVPPEVLFELGNLSAPASVRAWAADIPEWVAQPFEPWVGRGDSRLAALGAGEAAVIAAGQALGADLLLIDERAGRIEAERRGLRTTGTLGVLRTAALEGLLDFRTAIGALRRTSFRARPGFLDAVLAEWEESSS
jgi:predicted nucleic acid-binding protein